MKIQLQVSCSRYVTIATECRKPRLVVYFSLAEKMIELTKVRIGQS